MPEELSTSTNKPQKSSYTYTHVPHAPYPPLASAFEVSPQPEPSSSTSPAVAAGVGVQRVPYDTKDDPYAADTPINTVTNPLTNQSYGQPVVQRSYEPVFVTTMEPDLPDYTSEPAAVEVSRAPVLPPAPVTVQPQPAHEPTAAVVSVTPDTATQKPQEWRTSAFGCFSASSLCLGALFCTPCLFGRTSSLLRQYKNASYAGLNRDEIQTTEYLNSDCMVCGLCTVATAGIGGCLYVFARRAKVRDRYNLVGEDLDDICMSCACTCCAVAQMDMEVSRRMQSP